MKVAAIDIGSNAIRFLVSKVNFSVDAKPVFKRIEYIRFPLRLGHEVFTMGFISDEKRKKFLQLMQTYKLLIDLYEVESYMACATSAMRESENGKAIVDEVQNKIGLTISIIDGETEANLIHSVLSDFVKDETFLHIDVGGGSTELNLFNNGEKLASTSFNIGSVRNIEHSESTKTWQNAEQWVKNNIVKDNGKVTAIGTGGNINKLFDLADLKVGKSIGLNKLQSVVKVLESYTYEERQNKMQLNSDRADVILPAAAIYTAIMQWSGADEIVVPKVGLKDGILLKAYYKAINH